MSELWLVRHGESFANIQKEVTGSLNTTLTENGKSQALKLGEFLKNKLMFSPSRIITSTMTRALETSQLLNFSAPHTSFAALNETDAGDVATWKRQDFDDKHPDFWNPFDPFRKFPGGESHMDLYNRVTLCVEKILHNSSPDEKILVVCHQGTVSVILHHIFNVPMQNFSRFLSENGSVSALKFEKNISYPQLLFFNLLPL